MGRRNHKRVSTKKCINQETHKIKMEIKAHLVKQNQINIILIIKVNFIKICKIFESLVINCPNCKLK